MSKPDRRVRRTQQALTRSMIELILEQGFEATSVSQIAARADVGRSTFYAHYADKEDLLQGSLENLRQHLEARARATQQRSGPGVPLALAFCLPMLEHAGENRALFAAMVGRRSGALLQDLVHDIWADLVRQSWPGADEVAVQAIAGAFGATIAWWLSKAPELTPREVERRFRALMEPGLS